ncbi:hypothetical protein [Streptomyces sp. NPDC090025]|uniref:hypothetical protein n=1 Tax=Streptomyces sp. NPDC090025 TaxID=3365922 RepID=UPI003832AE5F
MNGTKRPLGQEAGTPPPIAAPRPGGAPDVRPHPAPRATARIVTHGGRGLARDRLRLLERYGARFRRAMAEVDEMLPVEWAWREGCRGGAVDVLADLAAVRLYLTGEWERVEPPLIEGWPGAHLALARCVASGLRRLPTHRGPVAVRTEVGEALARGYRDAPAVVDHGFWSASASPTALAAPGPGLVAWSLTGRRTDWVDPYGPLRVVFTPGTRFKALGTPAPADGRGRRVLLREMFPQEDAGAGGVGVEWLDRTTVVELNRAAAASTPAPLAHTACTGPRVRVPGFMNTPWT